MSDEIIKVPDIGSGSAEVIEVCVATGDSVAAEDSLIVLESDKATMEVPAPKDGQVVELLLKVGDTVSEGDDLLKLATSGAEPETDNAPVPEAVPEKASPEPEKIKPAPDVESVVASVAASSVEASSVEDVLVPDLGTENVPVIEICVAVGDSIAEDDSLVVLESDKATMEVPSPVSGVVKDILIKEGDVMNQGDLILKVEVAGGGSAETPVTGSAETDKPAEPAPEAPRSAPVATAPAEAPTQDLAELKQGKELEQGNKHFHAGPAVRKLAREFGVDLEFVKGTGPRTRILKEDVQAYVKTKLKEARQPQGVSGGMGIPPVPAQDYAKWGDIEEVALNRLRKVAAQNFQRSWLNVPHVTQFDKADITDLEAFRKDQKAMAEARGTKLTPLPFFLKACAYVLKEMPQFCSSLSADSESVIYKKYINIGVAVDTPDGLLVPVIKDVDKKSIWELSAECIELAGKARDKKLKPDEMQGGCFTISSLGSIGGTAFTPIVNAPEVAILGISKAAMKPVWNGSDFEPKLMCPLSLSYDHRVVNGADAARFTTMLGQLLADIRMLLL
ncbi:dihydrolipoyllysine-residue acetyltransferase [Endozoicomonas gorgoniicola]|uniref:Acetyltransferase component of pyruvate dehydrogenase complex n=1 Tax=Endozoicomonas gorgoniicola TaxID=1234144 RepID=A0ABT3N068_9GAMM|nr:dihydrolipoyllysine-residue acetyltransferase [Endozoicomonas gorgoniicola]MCW7555020.1 dihydrolipoyllysine-residue acetyltransferase [Endozoicomonas gorgoniicola]